jgi:hypothetical protein
MNAIQEPNEKFKFDNLVLLKPTNISGSNYFIKYVLNEYPLYIQSPKCKIKQGIQKGTKKLFCDLIFTNENDEFIQWLENLEKHSCKKIFENREKWFDTELDENDVEDMFLSPLKVYNSGKFYKVRVNIPTVLGKCNLKVYDENENIVDYENIKENDNIISILEIQGIRCSPRSFQIDLEMKQLLVLKPIDLFEKCILIKKTGTNDISNYPKEYLVDSESQIKEEKTEKISISNEETASEHLIENINSLKKSEKIEEKVNDTQMIEQPAIKTEKTEVNKNKDEIEEIELSLEEIPEEDKVILKKRNDVYYEMYKEALKKAKIAKELALASYLEAKRIKNTYMLTDIEEDDNFENEEYEKEDN